MKKQFNTRLTVKKQTVVNLEENQMNEINGGAILISARPCVTWISPCDTLQSPCYTYSKCNTACNSNPCC